MFDELMSPYAALHEEEKGGLVGKLLSEIIFPFERYALKHSDVVLTDTTLHARYLAKTFSINQKKIRSIPVGAVESQKGLFNITSEHTDTFSVLFYGSFLPLHGIGVIIEAAGLLRDLPVRFDFIGGTRRQAIELDKRCEGQGVTLYTRRPWVPFAELLESEIPKASLCLGGPFGDTPQAQRVVTGKTSQCLALSKATVIGRIQEDHGFIDRINCLLVDQGNPQALAGAIRWAYNQQHKLAEIGMRGKMLYDSAFSTRVIARKVASMLRESLESGNSEGVRPHVGA